MALPSIVDNGGEDVYFLNKADKDILDEVVKRERVRTEPVLAPDVPNLYIPSPEVLIVRIPEQGIDAMDFEENPPRPGRAECEVFKIVPSDELEPFTTYSELKEQKVEDLDIDKVWVFNVYGVKWWRPLESTPVFARATKDRSGRWLIEKPSYHVKVKPLEDVQPGETKECRVVIGTGPAPMEGAEIIEVAHVWMDGNQEIEANIEATAVYREYERKWEFDGAECKD
jgi:hypothetical protein